MTAPVPGHCILVTFIYNKSLFTIMQAMNLWVPNYLLLGLLCKNTIFCSLCG